MAATAPLLFLVDVFAESPYAGNQLAVVVGADGWDGARMQAFAREMNFSETTFASPAPNDGAFDVRIFTPAEELPFAGHPTLGTAWVLRRVVGGEPASVSLRLRVGVVPVEFEEDGGGDEGGLVRMRPPAPQLGDLLDGAPLAAHLGLDAAALHPDHPCRLVTIGVDFVVVPLRDLSSLRAARPRSLPAGSPGRMIGVLAVSPEPYDDDGDVAARMFFDALGIREDPATGSAAACLAAYLSSERWFGSASLRARVQQGYEVDRPSCLHIGAEPGPDGGVEVEVAGRVRLVARGTVA